MDAPESLHPCARCAQMQKTCCQRAEILVTAGDIARIGAHTGREGFWSLRQPNDAAYLEDDSDDPNWLAYTTDGNGRRRMLERKPSGDCTFLGDAGCVLPVEVRPIVCRLYPFAYNERGLDGMDDDYCPREKLIPRNKPGASMLTVLGMDKSDGERWRAQLYGELRREWSERCGSA